jgi:hypothetical protein
MSAPIQVQSFPWITLISETTRPPCFKDLEKCPDMHICKDLCNHMIACRLIENNLTREDVQEIITRADEDSGAMPV